MELASGNIHQAGLAAAVDQAADGVIITDTHGKIQYANPAFTRMTGFTKLEAVGRNPRILKSGKQAISVYEDLWRTIRAGQVWHGELINRRKDGTFDDEEMQVSPVRSPDGETFPSRYRACDVAGNGTAAGIVRADPLMLALWAFRISVDKSLTDHIS